MSQGNSARSRAQMWTRVAVRGGCMALAVSSTVAASALAAGPGLPRTYDATPHESPFPGQGGQYPLGLANAGDVDGDGKEDFITAQIVNTRDDAGIISAAGYGAIYVMRGATGARLMTIESPDPGGALTRANFAFPWVSKVGANRRAPAPFTDIGSCASPPPNAGELCRSATVGAPDGVPDILVGARGVDAKGRVDSGRVYVFDGATFALLKRIDQPASDTTDLALSRPGGTWFGRVVLNPSGLPPCEGNAGVGTCETLSPDSAKAEMIAKGDVDGGGIADLVVGASATSENSSTAHPGSHCARTPNAICQVAGRVYVYRGENIVGSSPTEILDGTVPAGGTAESVTTIRNPHAQADNTNPTNGDSDLFGNSITPIGDVGTCRATATVPLPAPGELCPRANGTTSPDGKPEFVISGQRNDLPLDAPDPAFADAGAAYLVDGATSTILAVYRHPEAQLGATFGSSEIPYATGDLGDTGLPDVFIPASGQSIPGTTSAGRGYVMNGNFQTGVNLVNFARLDDPTPSPFGGFGPGATGVGDLVPGPATPANEILVGAASSRTSVNDVHVFNAATEKVLQTIPDPVPGASQFGEGIIPLGDLNGDTFLDFGVTAPLYDSSANTDEGRVYVFRSNDTPLPPPPPAPPPPPVVPPAPPAPPPPPPAVVLPPVAELLTGRCANDMRGTGDSDSLIGTTAGDAVFSLDGDDVVEALAGHDCVNAGNDEDDVAGGAGNDSLLGGPGNDELDGGAGADRIFGQTGNDVLVGASGRDMLAGGDGNDRLNGGSGPDRLFGERGNDRLVAGDTGGNTLDGGTGDDHLDAVNGRRDIVRCGSGFDRAVVDRFDRVSGCERITRKRV